MSANPTRGPLSRLLAIVFACSLLAAACGPDGDAADVDSGLDALPAEPDSEDTPEPEPEDEPADDPEPEPKSGDGSEFCDVAEEVDNSLDALGAGEIPSPEVLEAQFTELQAAMAEAVRLAPDSIRPDVEKSAEAFGIMVDAFEAAEYNFFDVDLGALDVVDRDPAYDEATDAMTQFLFTDCGVGTDPSLDPDDDDFDDSDETEFEGTLREQITDELIALGLTAAEAACVGDMMDPETFSFEDAGALFTLLAACDISLDRLAELGG